ncbi:unnamed protein product, partial [Ixodes hexagonus]
MVLVSTFVPSEEPGLHSRRDDEFLLRFVRLRKYNVDAALKNVKGYYSIRKQCPPVFDNFVPSSASPAARKLVMVLPQRDTHGRPVLLLKAGAWDPQTCSYNDLVHAMSLVMEFLTMEPVAQTIGVSAIIDYGGFTVDKVLSLNIGLVKTSFKFFLDCVPSRTKAIHIVRQSYAFDMFYVLVRPFLSKKITDRIHFHGEYYEGLYDYMPIDVLPKEYGGLGPDIDFEEYWSCLDRAEQTFVENNRYGYH